MSDKLQVKTQKPKDYDQAAAYIDDYYPSYDSAQGGAFDDLADFAEQTSSGVRSLGKVDEINFTSGSV